MAYTLSIYEKETVILYNQSNDPINITTYDPSLTCESQKDGAIDYVIKVR